MTIPEIIAELEYAEGVFPREAVDEAVRQKDAVIPELLRIMKESTSNIEEIVLREDYSLHIFAMFLLAQFRDKRAYPLLVEFFTADQELVDQALGDVITECMGRILASVCQGDTSLIYEMVENPGLDDFVRSAAVEALIVLVAQGVKTREEVLDYFRVLFHKLEREFDFVWSSLVSHSCDLYPEEVLPEIQQAFQDDLVDTTFINRSEVERTMAEGKGSALTELRQNAHNRFIEDTVDELSSWAWFRPAVEPAPTPLAEWTATGTYVRTQPKIGRNQPCPCGSGKKYKKCCGA